MPAAARCALGILTPTIGGVNGTTVKRYLHELLPGETAVVAGRRLVGPDAGWTFDGPLLDLSDAGDRTVYQRGAAAICRSIGWQRADPAIQLGLRFLEDRGVQVILAKDLGRWLPWIEAARSFGMKYFVYAEDVARHVRASRRQPLNLPHNAADGVITACRFNASRLIALGINPARIHVVPNGVEAPAIPYERVPKPTVSCLAVGRMVGRKSPILLLDAFRRACESCPGLTLDLVGAGPLLAAAFQFVRAFNLESRVTIHGALPTAAVQHLMRDADLFVQHSVVGLDGDEEGLPAVILEAMAAGLPVVATRHAGIPEAVEDDVSGYLVSERDTVAMADRIVRLASDVRLRTAMGHAGWQYVTTSHSWSEERSRIRHILGVGPTVASPCGSAVARRR